MINPACYIGESFLLIIDMPIGTVDQNGLVYETNCGFVPNIDGGFGSPIRAYFIGTNQKLSQINGECIALIQRNNSIDDYLVFAEKGKTYTDEQIYAFIKFREKFDQIDIITTPC